MRLFAAVLLLLLSSACGRTPPPDTSGLPRRFGVTPAPAGSAPAVSPDASAPATSLRPGATAGPTPGARAVSPVTVTPVPSRTVGSAPDPAGDAGGPRYADLVAVTVAEQGSEAVVIVETAGSVPAQLAEGEVIGIGVDFYGSADAPESTHQLFADGGVDGWRAFLHGPDGIVQYPGTFRVDGPRLVFSLPWSALGDVRAGVFSAFADRSRRASGGSEQGRDDAPDSGRAPFGR